LPATKVKRNKAINGTSPECSSADRAVRSVPNVTSKQITPPKKAAK
jgi:hypothetical protein